MFEKKLAAVAVIVAALAFASIPAVVAQDGDDSDVENDELVTVEGTVTAFLYDDEYEDDQDGDEEEELPEVEDELDDDEDEDDLDDDEDEDDLDDENEERVCAFVIDDEIIVEFGPWWYWMVQDVGVVDVVEVGDEVSVTGEMHEDEDGTKILDAWKIENKTTGDELIIKEEGRPPWAGGPKALGIVPWPPSDEDEAEG